MKNKYIGFYFSNILGVDTFVFYDDLKQAKKELKMGELDKLFEIKCEIKK